MFHRLISHFISLAKTGVESRITKQIISRQEPGSFFANSFLSIDSRVFLKKNKVIISRASLLLKNLVNLVCKSIKK